MAAKDEAKADEISPNSTEAGLAQELAQARLQLHEVLNKRDETRREIGDLGQTIGEYHRRGHARHTDVASATATIKDLQASIVTWNDEITLCREEIAHARQSILPCTERLEEFEPTVKHHRDRLIPLLEATGDLKPAVWYSTHLRRSVAPELRSTIEKQLSQKKVFGRFYPIQTTKLEKPSEPADSSSTPATESSDQSEPSPLEEQTPVVVADSAPTESSVLTGQAPVDEPSIVVHVEGDPGKSWWPFAKK
jgi:chromosome segregation ATPase